LSAGAIGKKIVLVGGHIGHVGGFERLGDLWTLDTETHQFEQIYPNGTKTLLAHARMRLVTIDNKVYSFGGIKQDKSKLNSICTFDLVTNEWNEVEVTGTPPGRRCDPVMAAREKEIIIYGGSEEHLEFPNDMHVFDIEKLQWKQYPRYEGAWPAKRIGSIGGIVKNKLFVYGGGDYNRVSESYDKLYRDIWSFNLDTLRWTEEPATGDGPSGSVFMNCIVLGHHLVITDGARAHMYDTVSKKWSRLNIQGLLSNSGTCVKTDHALYFVGGKNRLKINLEEFAFLSQN